MFHVSKFVFDLLLPTGEIVKNVRIQSFGGYVGDGVLYALYRHYSLQEIAYDYSQKLLRQQRQLLQEYGSLRIWHEEEKKPMLLKGEVKILACRPVFDRIR